MMLQVTARMASRDEMLVVASATDPSRHFPVYHVITTHLVKNAGYTHQVAKTDAVALLQRFGSALNLDIHRTRAIGGYRCAGDTPC